MTIVFVCVQLSLNLIFNFCPQLPNCFQQQLYPLHSHQQCMCVPISPHPYRHFLFSSFKKIVLIVMGVKWCHFVVLICVSLMTNDVDYLYVFFGEMCIQLLCPFENWVVFFLLNCRSSLHILDTRVLLEIQFANIFSPSVDCLPFLGGVL